MTSYFASEAVIPMRREPAESAEMVSQLLFGDIALLQESQEGWLRVRHDYDGYEGWVSRNMLTLLSPEEKETLREWRYLHQPFSWLQGSEGLLRLPLGARVPAAERFSVGAHTWLCPEPLGRPAGGPSEIPALARAFLNTPYLWGGRSGFGIDCSGLAQTVFRLAGIALPRDSGPQQKEGRQVSFGERQAGDLAFFCAPGKGRVSHVGIVDEEGNIIHASGKVRIDLLTAEGILHASSRLMTHELLSINHYQIT